MRFYVNVCMQAERWGAELYTEDVEKVDLTQRPFVIKTHDREVCVCVCACRGVQAEAAHGLKFSYS